jgi:hypothetical protein
MLLLTACIAPTLLLRAILTATGETDVEDKGLWLTILYYVLSCILISGFCIAIIWRLKQLQSESLMNTSRSDSLFGNIVSYTI